MAEATMTFQYHTCVRWLREKAAKLTTLGLNVEVKENALFTPSFLLKAATSTVEAELVVWETGATSMIVFNCAKSHCDLDRSDIVLVGNQFEQELELFFDLLPKND